MKLLILTILMNMVLFGAQIVPINKSWQMIGISGDLSNLNDFNRSEIEIVWAYNGTEGWSAYSSHSELKEALSKLHPLASIPKNSAVWVLSNRSGFMKIDTNRTNTDIDLHNSWQMIGSDIGWSSLNDFNRSEVDSVWMYDGMNRKWKAFSHDITLNEKLALAHIGSLKIIPSNRGFWVHSNSDFSIDNNKIEDINTIAEEEVAPTQNAYVYNADGTAFLKIKQGVCNNWETAFSDTNFTTADLQTKIELYKDYVYQALEENKNENQLIYAPRGVAGDFNLTVKDGAIDLTNYKLPGDLNGDGNVTNDDIDVLAQALAMKDYVTPPPSYDVDKNGVVDYRDLLYIGARLMTQVVTFDIYSTDGQNLNIPTIQWNNKYYASDSNSSSLPSMVRVIAKDENGASSSDDEKITKDEWYKSFVSPKKLSREIETSCTLNLSAIKPLFATAQKKYVIGFSGDVRFIAGHLVNKAGVIDDNLSGCANDIRDLYLSSPTHKYFIPTDMGYIVKFAKAKNNKQVAVVDGYRFSDDELKDIKKYNSVSTDIGFEVHGYNKSIKQRFLHNGRYIITYARLEINAIFKESYKKYPMHGKTTRNTSDKYEDCGHIKYDRYGPAQQKDTEKTDLQRVSKSIKKYSFSSLLSMGHYHASIVWPKGGEYLLENNFIVKKDKTEKNFEIPWSPNSVKGHLYDSYDNPVNGKPIELRSTCDGTLKKYYTTKEDGSFEFKDVDIGEYEVLVDGEPKATVVQPGSGTQKEIKDKPLWKATIKYSALQPYGTGTLSVKRFKLDCENATGYQGSDKLGKMCVEIYDDGAINGNTSEGSDKATIKYSGTIHNDPNLSIPLHITTYGIGFQAFIPKTYTQLASTTLLLNSHNTYDLCRGVFPDRSKALDDIRHNRKIHFITTGNATCEFTLEPCKNDSCEDKSSIRHDDFDDFDDFDTQTDK